MIPIYLFPLFLATLIPHKLAAYTTDSYLDKTQELTIFAFENRILHKKISEKYDFAALEK